MIEKPIQRQHLLLLQNATNSQPILTQTGVVNLVAQSKTALHLTYLNSASSQVFYLPLWWSYFMEIHPPKSDSLKLL